ncbi:hypothetical protein GCM10022220_36610 [Actinocatenispora rupis]|uniref:Uncharacterized protein n=1 Tax=Actinocatenispora rupis TaxID=519421 RepID=A0A8J3NCX0_9ACTN|nr:hypothetical protein Aru02nite_31360 [Actinocatenispora rupis]
MPQAVQEQGAADDTGGGHDDRQSPYRRACGVRSCHRQPPRAIGDPAARYLRRRWPHRALGDDLTDQTAVAPDVPARVPDPSPYAGPNVPEPRGVPYRKPGAVPDVPRRAVPTRACRGGPEPGVARRGVGATRRRR